MQILRSITVLALAIVTVVGNASAQGDGDCSELAALAVGSWEWVETLEPWGGPLVTPESLGRSETVILHADFSLQHLIDNELSATSFWELRALQTDLDGPWACEMTMWIVSDALAFPSGWLQIDGDTMVVDGSGSDLVRVTLRKQGGPVRDASESWGRVKALFTSEH